MTMWDHRTAADILAAHNTPIGRAEYRRNQARLTLEAAENELELTLERQRVEDDRLDGYHQDGDHLR